MSLTGRGPATIAGDLVLAIVPAPPRCSRVRVVQSPVFSLPSGLHVVATRGLVSDGASIPALIQLKFGSPLSSCNALFGLPHDDAYRFGGMHVAGADGSVSFVPCSKDDADEMLYDLARAAGWSEVEALEIYEGVHLFGGAAWSDNARRRDECAGDVARLLAWV